MCLCLFKVITLTPLDTGDKADVPLPQREGMCLPGYQAFPCKGEERASQTFSLPFTYSCGERWKGGGSFLDVDKVKVFFLNFYKKIKVFLSFVLSLITKVHIDDFKKLDPTEHIATAFPSASSDKLII